MFKKAQLRFILINMLILLFVFGAISIGLRIMNNNSTLTLATSDLTDTIKSFKISEYEQDTKYYSSTYLQSRGVVIDYAESSVVYNMYYDAELIGKTFNFSFNNNTIYNKIYKEGNFYFEKYFLDKTYIIGINMTDTINVMRTTEIRVLLILIFIYILLFGIVISFSFIVIKPVKASFEKQKHFISDASHELKTPLTIINASADILSDENNQWVSNIKEQTTRMKFLIEDMLKIAKMDENKQIITYENLCLSKEIKETILPFDAVAFENNKEIEYDIQENIHINANKQNIKQLITILIDNSIKYGYKNEKIIVKLKKQSSKIIFSIYNKGCNVKKEDANKIFQRFYRGDQSRSRETGGSGLGLSIAKDICDINGYKISAKCEFDNFMEISIIF